MGLLDLFPGMQKEDWLPIAAGLLSGRGNTFSNLGAGLMGMQERRSQRARDDLLRFQLAAQQRQQEEERMLREAGQKRFTPPMPNFSEAGPQVPQAGGFDARGFVADLYGINPLRALEVERGMAKSAPTLKDTKTLTDPSTGKRVTVQFFDDGSHRVVPFGPDKDMAHFTDTGGNVMPVDPRTGLPIGPPIAKSMTPGDVAADRRGWAGMAQSERHFNTIKPQLVEGQQGFQWVTPPAPGQAPTAVPAGVAGTKNQPSESELTAAGYAGRMAKAEQTIGGVGATGHPTIGPTLTGAYVKGKYGAGAGRAIESTFMSPAQQQYRQAQEDWVRAKLRKESGAVIAEDEMQREIETYFPQPWDKPETIRQKARSRATAIEAMMTASGKARERADAVAGARPPLSSFDREK